MSASISLLFLGGWLPPFDFLSFVPGPIWLGLKIAVFAILFIVIRSVLPRYRYDQLMQLGWKVLMPVTLGWFFLVAGVLVAFDSLPNIMYIL
jgi:NADH-quinone oxidoreductase subunit H